MISVAPTLLLASESPGRLVRTQSSFSPHPEFPICRIWARVSSLTSPQVVQMLQAWGPEVPLFCWFFFLAQLFLCLYMSLSLSVPSVSYHLSLYCSRVTDFSFYNWESRAGFQEENPTFHCLALGIPGINSLSDALLKFFVLSSCQWLWWLYRQGGN